MGYTLHADLHPCVTRGLADSLDEVVAPSGVHGVRPPLLSA
jgi:hypothetical protein